MEQSSSADVAVKQAGRFTIPIVMGIVIAAVKMILSAIQYKYLLETYKGSVIIFSASFVVGASLLLLTGFLQQRKFGRTLTIKEAFQAIFIAILIVVVCNFIFDQLYMKLDPGMNERIYNGQVAFAKTAPNSADKIKVLTEDYNAAKTTKLSFGDMMAQLLNQIIKYSILGLIFALIVNKSKPVRTA